MLGRFDAAAVPTTAPPLPEWIPTSRTLLLPGTALWALALYLPLSAPLSRLEQSPALAELSDNLQQVLLVVASLLLALVVGGLTNLALGWALGPGWGTSLGLMAALYGLFWGLAANQGGSSD